MRERNQITQLLQENIAVKISATRLIFLLAWILAAVVQIVEFAYSPKTIVIAGVDESHAIAVGLLHQWVFIGLGIVVAVVAYRAGRRGPIIVIFASIVYLLQWFPFRSVYKAGLVAVAKSMFLIVSHRARPAPRREADGNGV